jgi:hypothetical protein
MTDIQLIDEARKYANLSQFKSDYPHDWQSCYDAFYDGLKRAQLNNDLISQLLMSIDDLLPEDHMIKKSNSYKKLISKNSGIDLDRLDKEVDKVLAKDIREGYFKPTVKDSSLTKKVKINRPLEHGKRVTRKK